MPAQYNLNTLCLYGVSTSIWKSVIFIQHHNLIGGALRKIHTATKPGTKALFKVTNLIEPGVQEPGDLHPGCIQPNAQRCQACPEGKAQHEDWAHKYFVPDTLLFAEVDVEIVPRHGTVIEGHTDGRH